MTPDRPTPEAPASSVHRRRRFPIGLVILVFFLGLYLGAAIDAASRPNHIVLEVDPYNAEIDVAPLHGDDIRWVDSGGKAVKIQFGTESPCKGDAGDQAPTSTCVIESAGSLYQYLCITPTCKDPGLDPASATSINMTSSGVWERPFIAPFQDVGYFFNHSLRGFHAGRQDFPRATDAHLKLTAADSITVPIKCDNNVPVINLNQPVYASANEVILWRASNWNFTIQLPPNFCTGLPSGTLTSSSGNASCSVVATPAANITYPITLKPISGTAACTGQPTNNILQPPQ